jgi:hypothetical protein
VAQEVISDADMQRLFKMGKATRGPASPAAMPSAGSEMPDTLTDEQMQQYLAPPAYQGPQQPPPEPSMLDRATNQLKGSLGGLAGFARTAIAQPALGALQWGQNIIGAPVTPTPPMLEPSLDPHQQVGETLGKVARTVAPSIASGGAAMPVQAAVGAMVGGAESGSPYGAAVGGAVPYVASRGGAALNQYVKEHELAARVWNKVVGVPGGRRGVQVDMATGATRTNPGRALLDPEKSPLGQLSEAVFAKPDDVLRVKVEREFGKAGQAIENYLSPQTATFEVGQHLQDLPKVRSALAETGLPTDVTKDIHTNALNLHRLRHNLGKRINWNPVVVTDSNEAMKDAYVALGQELEKNVKGLAPLSKRWQEAFLYRNTLQHKLQQQNIPLSLAGKAALGAGTALGVPTLGMEIYKHLP